MTLKYLTKQIYPYVASYAFPHVFYVLSAYLHEMFYSQYDHFAYTIDLFIFFFKCSF